MGPPKLNNKEGLRKLEKFLKMDKDRSEYVYEIYLFSEPYFMHLENEIIVDINIDTPERIEYREIKHRYGDIKVKKQIIIEYADIFFDYNIRNSNRDRFSITIYSFNKTGQFLQQLDIHGENMIIKNNSIILEFDQVTNNNAWYSVNTNFVNAADVYQRERMAYYRDRKIDKLLS